MKKLHLSNLHEHLGAKMIDFSGFQMPVQYRDGVLKEHLTVREGVGVFDVSHMGEFFISGENALELVQKITTNDASKLSVGKAQYSCMTNEKGGIIDDLIVYRIENQKYMLVVNGANIEKDWQWIVSQNAHINAHLINVSDEYTLFAVQGPKAIEVLQKLTNEPLSEIPFYQFKVGALAGIPEIIISATGYTGSGGVELYCKNDKTLSLWESIFEAGANYGIKPIGLAARDTLRMEMGYCLHGNDIDENTSPLEARLGWITKFNKDFIGIEVLKRQSELGVDKKLVGFELIDKGIPRKGYDILSLSGHIIGKVTSGTMSPSLKKAIGMGYVNVDSYKLGEEIFINIRNQNVLARFTSTPFYKPQKS